MATAFIAVGQGWAAVLVSIGAVYGLTSVIMIQLLGASCVKVEALFLEKTRTWTRPHLT